MHCFCKYVECICVISPENLNSFCINLYFTWSEHMHIHTRQERKVQACKNEKYAALFMLKSIYIRQLQLIQSTKFWFCQSMGLWSFFACYTTFSVWKFFSVFPLTVAGFAAGTSSQPYLMQRNMNWTAIASVLSVIYY